MREVFVFDFSLHELLCWERFPFSARSSSRAFYKQYKQTKKTGKDLGLQRGKMKRRFFDFPFNSSSGFLDEEESIAAAAAWRHGWCWDKEWGKSTRVLAIFLSLIFCLLLNKNTYVLDGLL